MQYQEAIDYLYSRLPVFHRIGPKALKPGLDNTLKLCSALGNPQHKFPSIHVAGTNGKGSTSHMLAAIYQSAGYRVGLYTSPHLQSFTERIRINGQPIAEEDVADFVRKHQLLIESIEPSFFEVTVAMAFDYFARQSLDLAIIEVGLGGRLDSTNVITPLASVITNIGFDHTEILGDTLPQIAREKAGIIKESIPVIVGETNPETAPVFVEIARSVNAPIMFADERFLIQDRGVENGLRQIQIIKSGIEDVSEADILLDLLGDYQLRNLPGVLATVDVLQKKWPVSQEAIQSGLRTVVYLTGLKGRFQTLQFNPRVLVDTAHNQAGLAALFLSIKSLTFATLRIIVALVADKERTNVISLFPVNSVFYFCEFDSQRSLSSADLQMEFNTENRFGNTFSDVNQALSAALQDSIDDDLILITGSNFHIAELINL
ncbi:folylpolyglutamate synthase/dihydrofolate synthase family protein [Spirosoma terrae]|uniref:Dihydrofolate synthase/folylpolyglutamate synthase n=1 Tax=Spirosoma terrae TaxID=1968276 RepID=A0A6L9LP02_9BACT|nr:folylpolyglutamate synthase/dihydrofolate synthase family protein [Spirosoma terrae]NDU98639.1 bifunctional folylpolyglutamate synthase/dihydrofolate synthase [Spirosoma terrae]